MFADEPGYNKWRDAAFGGKAPGSMEIDPRDVPRGIVHIAGKSPIDKAAELIGRKPTDAEQAGDTTFVRNVDPLSYRQWHLPPLTANDNKPLPKVVALAGSADSGKSTAADYLVQNFGYTRLKFAGPLKAMCRAIGMTDAMIEGSEKELPVTWLQDRSPRYVMQRLGTDWGRDLIGPDLWTGLFQKAANDVIQAGGRVVVDDCRFDNEATVVQSMGGVVIRLVGRGGIGMRHRSEQITEEVNSFVHNDGTIGDLHNRLREAILSRV